MQPYPNYGPWPLLLVVILVATAVACSDEGPEGASDGQVFVSEKGFIKVGIGTSVDDVYPSGLDPSCVSPGPGYPAPAHREPRTDSPPVPGYLPEESALNKEIRHGDRHVADSYISESGSFRFTVSHWTCGGLSLQAEAHWELVTVAGHWGVLFEGACFEGSDGECDWDPDFARTLWFETDRGYVELRSTVNPLGKGELLKIAKSMPVFDG